MTYGLTRQGNMIGLGSDKEICQKWFSSANGRKGWENWSNQYQKHKQKIQTLTCQTRWLGSNLEAWRHSAPTFPIATGKICVPFLSIPIGRLWFILENLYPVFARPIYTSTLIQDILENRKFWFKCCRTYSCVHCRAHLANHDELISKSFQGNIPIISIFTE